MSRKWLKLWDSFLSWPCLPIAVFISLIKTLFYKSSDKSLIVRPGGMGDLVLLTLAIKTQDDLDRYVFIIEPRSEIWAKHLSLNYFLYDDFRTPFRLPVFNKVICSEQFFGLAFIYSIMFSRVSDVTNIRCFQTNRLSLLGKSIDYQVRDTHETDSFSDLIFGQRVAIKFEEKLVPLDYDVVYFGGSMEASRKLNEENWNKILNEWRIKSKKIIIITSPTEKLFAKEIFKNEEIFEGNFEQTIDILRRAKRILTIDSGAVHICSYYNLVTDVIFTSGQEKKWGPMVPGSCIYFLDLPCRPCVMFGQVPDCLYNYRCTSFSDAQNLKRTIL